MKIPTAGDLASLTQALDEQVPRLFSRFDVSPQPQPRRTRIAARWRVTAAALRTRAAASLRGTARRRDQASVREQYERAWAGTAKATKLVVMAEHLYAVREPLFLNWFYVLAMAQLIRLARPRTVLEVGSGNGFNLNCLSMLFPECTFVGLDFTEAGVRHAAATRNDPARAVNIAARFAGLMPDVSVAPVSTARYFRGTGAALPFRSRSVDLVISVLALEQMNPIRSEVIGEIARVSRGLVAHIEPFADFNADAFRRMHLSNKDYFRSPSSVLETAHLRRLTTWSGFPQKLNFSAGLVLAAAAEGSAS